ncbi:MAG: TatD family hydrolase [Mycoplasmoidaceae bacterium]|nr:MAG: TatD family hydrolase [Mycoplasmoidaceae bacterium]
MKLNLKNFKYFDTHCHLNVEPLLNNIDSLIFECMTKQVFINCVGVDCESSSISVNEAKKYKNCAMASVGIHPEYPDEILKINQLEKLISDNKDVVKAVGECGLDYHIENYDKEKQTKLFIAQIELAIKYKLTLIIHCRDAYDDLYKILEKYHKKLSKILIHCYDSTSEWVAKFNKFNCYYAIGGKITYAKSDYLRDALKVIPLNRLVCETDCPFLSPIPIRNETNKPTNVILIEKYISNFLKKNIGNQVYDNSIRLFDL